MIRLHNDSLLPGTRKLNVGNPDDIEAYPFFKSANLLKPAGSLGTWTTFLSLELVMSLGPDQT